MEVLLNTIWFLLAMGAFLFWRPSRLSGYSAGHRESPLCGIMALACVLVLLFPVISLTDDLHVEQVALEESSRSTLKARSVVQGCLRAGAMSFIVVGAHTPSSFILPPLFGKVYLAESRSIGPAPVFTHVGRSPPCTA